MPIGPLERAVERGVERALIRVLDSDMADRVWEELLASDQAQKLVERIAEAPEVRNAITSQGVGLVEDVGRQARAAARRLDGTAERVIRRILFRKRRKEKSDRGGLVTRGLAIAVDAAILNGIFFIISGILGLVVSGLAPDADLNHDALVAAGGSAWVVFGGAYLLFFWTLTSQTPGMRFMGLRLATLGADEMSLGRSVRRLIGLALAVIPVGLGLLPIATNERRRGLQDRFAGTEVVLVPNAPRAAPWSTTSA